MYVICAIEVKGCLSRLSYLLGSCLSSNLFKVSQEIPNGTITENIHVLLYSKPVKPVSGAKHITKNIPIIMSLRFLLSVSSLLHLLHIIMLFLLANISCVSLAELPHLGHVANMVNALFL